MPQPKAKPVRKSTKGKDVSPKRPPLRKPTRKRLSTVHREPLDMYVGDAIDRIEKCAENEQAAKDKMPEESARPLSYNPLFVAPQGEENLRKFVDNTCTDLRRKVAQQVADLTGTVNGFKTWLTDVGQIANDAKLIATATHNEVFADKAPSQPDPNLCESVESVVAPHSFLANWLQIILIINIIVVAADLIHRIAAKWIF